MAQTPEGKVKAKVKLILNRYKPDLWYDMPVPGGFGSSQLDFTGWILGRAFVIETKAPGKKLTARQGMQLREMTRAGATGFVIDGGDTDYEALDTWLHDIIVRNDDESFDSSLGEA